jgi:hypothetical protein
MLMASPDAAAAVIMGSALPMTSASLRLLPPSLRQHGRGQTDGEDTAKDGRLCGRPPLPAAHTPAASQAAQPAAALPLAHPSNQGPLDQAPSPQAHPSLCTTSGCSSDLSTCQPSPLRGAGRGARGAGRRARGQ